MRCYGLANIADALTHQSVYAEALATAKDGLSTAEKTGYRQWEAELKRLEGVALSGLNRLEEAQNALAEALRIAQKQKARAFELRAAMSMARLWRDQGKRQQAHDLLAPVYGWFTEGFDTLDLKEAKALLEQLRA
jgi:predicted ATPase